MNRHTLVSSGCQELPAEFFRQHAEWPPEKDDKRREMAPRYLDSEPEICDRFSLAAAVVVDLP
jgi:hypothetical protein